MVTLKKELMAIKRIVMARYTATIARKKKGVWTMEHIPMIRGQFEWALARLRKGCAVRAVHWPEDFFLMINHDGLPQQNAAIFLYNRHGCFEPWQPSSTGLLEHFYEEFDLIKALECKALSRLKVVNLKIGDVEIPIDRITEWSRKESR